MRGDQKLRELERLAAQGDPQASVQLLLLRVRQGLPVSRLVVAFQLGFVPAGHALEALGQPVGWRSPPPSFTDGVAGAYGILDEETIYRCLLDLSREVFPEHGSFQGRAYLRTIDILEEELFQRPLESGTLNLIAENAIQESPGDPRGIAIYSLVNARLHTSLKEHRGDALTSLVMVTTDITNYLHGEPRHRARQWFRDLLIQELLCAS